MVFIRGKQPSAIDCLTQEKVAVVIVLQAINAAILAMRKISQKIPSAWATGKYTMNKPYNYRYMISSCKVRLKKSA